MLSHNIMLCSVTEIENGNEGSLAKNFITHHSSFSVASSVHSNVHIFAFFVCVDLLEPTPEWETSVSELPLLFATAFFLIEIYISDSRNSSETEWLTCKQWPQKVNTYNEAKNLFDLSQNMSPKAGVWVFCEDLNSNSVFKLFILIWSYEGMKVMNFGFVKSNGKLSTMLKLVVFITLV